ncbi:MAG: TonB-dependent receptor [Bacteroidales bacterium]|nr:TonB-dependent receptor [Bacteroidales bacterium]
MKKLLICLLFLSSAAFALAQNATVTGTIVDAVSDDFLAGATVVIKGTSKGTSADANGHYTLSVPAGRHTVQFIFLGYETREFDIRPAAGSVEVLQVRLVPEYSSLEGVVVQAQARGQQAAINSQIRASGIMNAVSAEKLGELPDVNVADAIGRLPGLMVSRDGGEGQKIIIRGLEPKYNTVAINGMNTPSTSDTDRSTDLNMISPDMIAGAEVLKANTADKDADGLGGTVNLVIRDAPYGPRLFLSGETGYHSQIGGIGRYKGGVTASNRFFGDRLGLIFSSALDRTDRSNDTFSASYLVNGTMKTEGYDYTRPWLTTTQIQSNQEIRTRFNFNLNADWDLGETGKIRFSNIMSRMERDRTVRAKRYNFSGSRLRYAQRDLQSHTTNLSNILQAGLNVLSSRLDIGAGHSSSWMRKPWSNELEFRLNTPFTADISFLEDLLPYDAVSPEYVSEDDLGQYYLYNGRFEAQRTHERELSAWLDWTTPYRIGDVASGSVKFGGKYRQKDRSNQSDAFFRRFDLSSGYESVFERMPDLTHSEYRDGTQIGIADFLDGGYVDKGDFLRGRYPNCNFNFALDNAMMRRFYETNRDLYYRLLSETVENDYSGHEEIYAGYVMTELEIGDHLVFTPGLRYDYSRLRYSAYSGANVDDDDSLEQHFEYEETTDTGRFGYLLPQVHLRIKPTSWMDLRLAYTHTLSRPDYNLLAPRTIVKPTHNTIDWSRTDIKPALSKNYDATLSFYPARWGLFTVSGFYKHIDHFIYTRTAVVLEDTETDPSNFGLSDSYAGAVITYPVNNPTRAMVMGLEFDAQVQFSALDNFLRGFVLNANFTVMDSEMAYNTTRIARVANPDFGFVAGVSPFLQVNRDVAYVDRLLSQPTYLFNLSVGYDYKRFSCRVSCNYQDGVLVTAQQRADAADKELSDPFVKWDAQARYKLGKNLAFYVSWSNINRAVDGKTRYVTGYPMRTEYYGSTAYLGIRYDIIR